MVKDFRQDYNRCRPHRAHAMMTPAAFRTGWETAHEAAPGLISGRSKAAPTLAYAEGDLVRLSRADYRRYSAAPWTYGQEVVGRIFGAPAFQPEDWRQNYTVNS
jgi:hypothetical protein